MIFQLTGCCPVWSFPPEPLRGYDETSAWVAAPLPLAPPPRAVSPPGQVAVAVLPLVTCVTTVVTA